MKNQLKKTVKGMNIMKKTIRYHLCNPKLTPSKQGHHRSSRTYSL